MGPEPTSDAEVVAEQWVQDMRGLLSSLPSDLWGKEAAVYAAQGKDMYRRYVPRSHAHADADSTTPKAIDLILSLAQDALMGTADHMEAFDRALADPPRRLSLSPWTIARTALEAEARVSWMLEPESSAREKASRAILLTIRDTEWGFQEVGQGRITDESLANRMLVKMQAFRNPVESLASDLGLEVKYGTRFGVKAIERVGDCRRPSISELVQRLLGRLNEDPTYYPMLSEVSHQSSFAKYLADIEVMPSIVFHSIYFFAEISWRYFQYCGLPLDDFVPLLDEALGQSEIPEDKRFWQQRPQPQR